MVYKLVYTNHAKKGFSYLKKAKRYGYCKKVALLLDIIAEDPRKYPPPIKKLKKDLKGAYARRISQKHRLVYTIDDEQKTVKILLIGGHYG